MRLHEGKLREASKKFSFFLENMSTALTMKKIGGAKGVTLLVVRLEVVAPLISHVLGALLTWVKIIVHGAGALLAQNKEKL